MTKESFSVVSSQKQNHHPAQSISSKMREMQPSEFGMELENGSKKWGFKGNEQLLKSSAITVRGVLNMLMANIDPNDTSSRPTIPLGHGDPSPFPSFRTTPDAEKAISDSLYSANFNCYSPTVGILPARKAVAEFLSKDIPHQLSPDDVFLTGGCTQAIEVIITVLACPNANILLPRPGFPYYEACAAFHHLECRHFDLLPEKHWEVDLDAVEALADENTVAMVILNPGNPCGNVYTYQHLKQVAETARKLGILVIADEVYAHLTFGSKPFVPMGTFGSIAPVITLGSISKRWIVPGWRIGWLVINDPNGILKRQGVVDSIIGFLNISTDPATFIQGALPNILQGTKKDFFTRINGLLREGADVSCEKIKEIPCINCPSKPQGAMYIMVKLDVSLLDGIEDDLDFCVKLAKEESLIVLPGVTLGLRNWIRITFSVEPSSLDEGLQRLKSFCQRRQKQ